MTKIVCIDAGSSSLRSVLFNEVGSILYLAQEEYTPNYQSQGKVEQNPQVWENALCHTLQKVTAYANKKMIKIGAVSLTSQRSSVFAVDKEGTPLCYAMTWHDKRSREICERLRDKEKYIFEKTGLRLNPMFSAPKMVWIKENKAEIYEKSYKLIGTHEYLLHCLTGQFVTDYSIASRTMLQNLYTLEWDKELLELFSIDQSKLCDTLAQGSICGRVSHEMSRKSGLDEGIKVVSAGGDQQCAALGLGIIQENQIEITTGTGGYVVCLENKPVIDENMRFLCNVSAIPGRYILEASIPTAANVYRWFGNLFIGKNEKEFNEIAEKSVVGANGLIFFPYFHGSGAPDWNDNARGSFININFEVQKQDFVRAILEGIAFSIAKCVDVFLDLKGNMKKEIFSSGGLSCAPLYNQILSNILNQDIQVEENHEATALGAWISASVVLGNITNYEQGIRVAKSNTMRKYYMPDLEKRQIYEVVRKEWNRNYQILYEEKDNKIGEKSL